MRRSRFSEEQIIQAIKRMDAGLCSADVSDAQRLRQLEDENSKLKRMVTEQALDIDALKVPLGEHS